MGMSLLQHHYLSSRQVEDVEPPEPPVSSGAILSSELEPTAAWGPSLIVDGYDGPVLLARRVSDNAELAFTADEITDGTLVTWSGGGDVAVKTLYDQAGIADATQTAPANQPLIVDDGALVTENGKPAFSSNQNTWFNFSSINTVTSVFMVVKALDNTTNQTSYLLGDGVKYDYASGETGKLLHSSYSAAPVRSGSNYLNSVLTNFATTTRPLSQSLITMIHNGTATATSLSKDRTQNPARSWIGIINAVIIYTTNQSANRTAIETAINDFYDIY
jgi:hypothetical protein